MIKKSLVLMALLASACSSGGTTPDPQQRITELEQENAQLRSDLQKAKADVAAMQRVLNSNEPSPDEPAEDAPSGPVAPAPSNPNPVPANNAGGGAT